ncbi:MAG TPA: LuxR C-terminal-related transcriptional regulator, partial [Vicinamibacterales bacterium]|nr:LuxR C-terminal-related transcriptional regulator [Vicinamibacterales bacterium]
RRIRAVGHPEEDVDVLAELFAEDVQEWPADAWLAIDDYQFAMESVASERFVERLAEGTSVQLVVATRRRPRWAAARRIIYGEIQELERHELAMEPGEAKKLIGRDDASVGAFLERAQGWPAIIQLAASSTEVNPPREGLPPALYDYFAEELYQSLGSDLQLALCRLCIPPSITRGLEDVLFHERGGEFIAAAVRLGVLGHHQDVLEMHPLLRGFLEPKLASLEPQTTGHIARRVIDHLLTTGDWDGAYDVIVRFDVPAQIEQLVSSALTEIMEEGRLPTLAQWLDTSAKHHVTAPVLDLAEAELAFRQGRYGTATALARSAAHRAAKSSTDETLRARTLLRAAQSALLDSRGTEALVLFREAQAIAPTRILERESLLGQFFALIDLRSGDAEDLLAELDQSVTEGSEDLIRMSSARILYADRTGGLLEALERARHAHPLLTRITDPVIRTSFVNCFGHALAITGQYEQALSAAGELASAAEEYRLGFVLPHAAIIRATAAIGLRDVAGALEAIADAERDTDDPHILFSTAVLRARLALLRGEPDEALAVLRTPVERRPTEAASAEYLGNRALAEAAAGALDAATQTTDEILLVPDYARGATTTAKLVRTALELHTDTKRLAAATEDIVAFVFEGGRLDELVTVYRSFPVLLSAALSSEEHGAQVAALVGRANDGALAKRVGFDLRTPLSGSLGRLTPREQEVLSLIARGFTNRKIADKLVISESTVKVHVRHVLEKLGARSRTEAASRFGGAEASGD